MKTFGLCCAAALTASLTASLTAMATTSAYAQNSVIGEIRWHYIDSYCTFRKADHAFDFNNPDSWVWVAFTNLPDETTDVFDRMFFRINGHLREFTLQSQSKDGETVMLDYATADAEPIKILVKLTPDGGSPESTNYTGTISELASGETLAIAGDCGV